jgi:2-keto-4-pentenoate hydratase/2-oxohepta-3-ene-1,7-dioic acid hydratase in catechol pathway
LLRPNGSTTEVIDLTDELPDGTSWLPLITDWQVWKPRLETLTSGTGGSGVVAELNEVRLQPPLADPTARIFALGANFADHIDRGSAAVGSAEVRELAARRPLTGFFVIPGTLAGPDEDINPPDDALKIDYEAEVAVVLRTGGFRTEPETFSFWGHTAYNDVSIRDPHLGVGLKDLDSARLSWSLQKNFRGGNVFGPWLAVDEGYDYGNLAIRSRVNGEQRQNGSTAQMIVSFTKGAAALARFLELRPGDMLASGTPAGTAIEQGVDGPFLKSGDVVEVEVEGAGILRNRIVR